MLDRGWLAWTGPGLGSQHPGPGLVLGGVMQEFLSFLAREKLYWLVPMALAVLAFALLLYCGGPAGDGAVVYTVSP